MILNILLIIAAVLIILSLAIYAGRLLSKVAQQNKALAAQQLAQQQAITARNSKISESIRLIAKAIVEQQCELSEGAIRISRLLETIHVTVDANYPQLYPAIHQLDQYLAEFPTHQAIKT